MIGPIGVYYIYITDVHPTYKASFSGLLWWMFQLRQRQTFKNMLDPNNKKDFTFIDWGRERLAELEYLMPFHFCRFTIHLMQHACRTLWLTGPVYGTWMFVYERWIKIGKGFMHSSKSAGAGLMASAMTHEWLIRNNIQTQDDLNKLMTPPLSHFINKPKIRLLGKGQPSRIHQNIIDITCDYRLICNFLLTNDDVMKIINAEFETTHLVQSKNGSLLIYNWKIPDLSYTKIKLEIKNKFNKDITEDEINKILKGPVSIYEYARVNINGLTFVTDAHENTVSRITRKFIYYRKPLDGKEPADEEERGNQSKTKKTNQKDKNKNKDKLVARIDKIYNVLIRDVGDGFKTYTLLKITNYTYMKDDHESELPYVQKASEVQNVHDEMPVILINDVLPVNIALWPSTLDTKSTFLVVHSDPFFGD